MKLWMTAKQSTPSRVRFAEEGPSTVQAAPVTPITPTTDTTATSPSVDDLYLDSFNFALSKTFSSSLMASLTTKDAILKEIRDCILTDNADRCRQISPYIHSFWKDLHVKNGCVCIDDRIALPHAIKDAYVDAIHATHHGTWGMTDMATHAWWPYMHRDIATKISKCNPCVKIGKNLKPFIRANNWAPLKLCKVPNEEYQIDFGGPIYNEKNQEIYFLACIDRFLKFPTAEVFDRANADNFLKFLQEYVLLHGIPRAIRLDQARCQTGQQIKTFCSQNNIQLIEAPIHDHRAIGLVERLIQTIKNRQACIKTAAQNQFNVKASINSIIYQLRICRQKTINISPFEAHFGRKANTPLSNITTTPDPKSLTYKNILNKYLDLETVRWDQLITDENWDNDERSDIEVEVNKDKLGKEAMKRQKEDPNKESILISHPDVGQSIPRTETSLEVKLAKKRPRTKKAKKSLDGLYDVLAPGSSVIKTNERTSVIKEPGKREVTIRNSDLAKFGTRAERDTELQVYANRRPKLPTGKSTEELINHHAKESRKKLEGGKRMKHRKVADDVSTVSSIHSNVTRALRVIMQTKPKKQQSTAPPNQPTNLNTDPAVPMGLPTSSIVIAEPPSRPKRKAATKASVALLPSKRKRSAISITESDESVTSTQTCPPTTPSTSAIGKQKRRLNIKKQLENKTIISAIQTAASQSNQEETNFTVGPCSPTTSYPTQFYVSPNYEEPELSMTVGEAERYYESESD